MEPIASILSCGVEALVGLVGLGSQGRSCEPHAIVGGAVHLSYRADMVGGSSYQSSSPGGAVLSAQRGTGMAFVRTEG
jgi:hypothetical protein